MKDAEGVSSKGCAFIEYATKESALLAIRHLNAQAYLCGSDKPIEVRFAENKKTKTSSPPWTNNSTTNTNPNPRAQSFREQPAPYPPTGPVFYEYYTETGKPYYFNSLTGETSWSRPAYGANILPGNPGPTSYYGAATTMPSTTALTQVDQQYGVNKQGPPGCNLFLFHLPNEWRVQELLAHFSPFGNIVSARIMTEKATGRSKGFGFVSYDNPQSAQAAIKAMNGYSVMGKKLKVELKKGDGEIDDDASAMSMMHGTGYHPYGK